MLVFECEHLLASEAGERGRALQGRRSKSASTATGSPSLIKAVKGKKARIQYEFKQFDGFWERVNFREL